MVFKKSYFVSWDVIFDMDMNVACRIMAMGLRSIWSSNSHIWFKIDIYINGVKSEYIGVRSKSYVQLLTVSILDLMIRLIEIQIY